MSKLIMMSGLPASGKSTQAAEIVETGNWVRVNRDLLRTMLHFDKWSGRNEKLTVDAEKAIVGAFLSTGNNVVVDDTNLNPKNREMWSGLAVACGASFEERYVDTDWAICAVRDEGRAKNVGTTVIKNMAMQYRKIKFQPDSVVICDLDGTLCDVEHRRHYVKKEIKDWHGFFSEIANDKVRHETYKMLVDFHNQGKTIVFVSARPEEHRVITEKWLKQYHATFHFTLIMRKQRDSRPDTEVKKEILDTYFDKETIHCVIDDRPSVIRMWREEGLRVIDVGDGVEF